ncbi:type 4a pilus biogenesis protein PilO [Aquabacterium sp. A08]|uniref:type 4a pilus biogenesis protein PilO n=1 Tax=Aquabacterium sp. A08 TaxID=2718532 RepID=UPI001423671C|nr:type 4a pilus biogenesis protein PilO [Aquabacterium sp. A08]NIC42462.1 type 4a pilus biogenesis protein PilO [Aquabacterium sp. A08]NIC42501.1 type 4a pilus biogenesis protein PilO [Aquabacterium sp. A08]
MAKTSKKSSIDFAALQQNIRSQFTGLDPNDPSLWPNLPRYLLLCVVAVLVVVALWYVWLSDLDTRLTAERNRETQLRAEYTQKLGKTVNFEILKAQLEQVRQYVAQLEKQLPSKAEMDALLSDINQAGLGRSLQFELFRPGQEVVRDYYAELPITVRVTGSYNEVGLFVSDVAHLSRIVTLNNLALSPVQARAGVLTMDATAKTFRYLDPDEVLAQKNAQKAKEAKK